MMNAYLLDPRFAITEEGLFSLKDHYSDLPEDLSTSREELLRD